MQQYTIVIVNRIPCAHSFTLTFKNFRKTNKVKRKVLKWYTKRRKTTLNATRLASNTNWYAPSSKAMFVNYWLQHIVCAPCKQNVSCSKISFWSFWLFVIHLQCTSCVRADIPQIFFIIIIIIFILGFVTRMYSCNLIFWNRRSCWKWHLQRGTWAHS